MRRISYKLRMEFTCFLIIFVLGIDQGDGHWKEKEKENFRHDIELYEKMAEKIEREIESFYDKYPGERYKDANIDRIPYKHVTNILNRHKEIGSDATKLIKGNNLFYTNLNNVTNDMSLKHQNHENNRAKDNFINNLPNKSDVLNSTWPKFEDILLAMGKKYDWKNDRWIKAKAKLKETKKNVSERDNSVEFHEKHKFSYRIVKLNKSKSRRNVVVAVSAVR